MHLELRHLKLIRAIAEAGSITKAGPRLYLTQSALSHQLRDAEDKLGTPLFARINKRMILTPAGERLLVSAEKVLDEMGRAEEDIRQIALNREGILRITTECYTCYHWLPSVLGAFHERFPRVEVQIVVDATEHPHQAILDGRVELALGMSAPSHNKLQSRPLFRDELVVVVAPFHRLAERAYARAEDFRGEHLLTYSGPEKNFAINNVLIPAGVAPARVSSVRLTEAIIEMVKAGAGIAVMARWAVRPLVEIGSVVALPLTRRGTYRRWSAVTLKGGDTPAHIEEFIKLLIDSPVLISGGTPKAKKGSAVRLISAVDCNMRLSS